MEFEVPLAILLTLVGCHVNIVSLECVIHHDNGKRVGSLITFLQFLLLSGAGFLFLNKTVARGYFTLRKRPPRSLMLTIGFFFLTNLLNNNVYQYNLSVPVVTVIRVSSLIATLVLGMGYMKKKYTKRQIVAVFLVFLGVSLVSVNVVPSSSSDLISHKTQNPQEDSRKLGSEPERQVGGETDVPENPSKNVLPVEEWAWTTIPPEVLGLSILFFSTMGSSVLSLAQESVYKTDSRLGPMDLLFFSHFCSLPLFLSHGSDITSSLLLVRNQQELWNPILANLISQCVCIFSVFYLTKSTNALTTSVIITGRKFFSLLFSVWYFQNPFSLQQWLGSVLAFWGVLFYSLPEPPEQSKRSTV